MINRRNFIYVKALIVALAVGTILLMINQFDSLFGSENIRIVPAILTYCVPFIVFVLGNKHSTENNRLNKNFVTRAAAGALVPKHSEDDRLTSLKSR
ncbi:hypothetical protein A9Q98_03490 [Thalassotalea sp. 42_200_T64]|nr:hypothetical protein A9Q98_03490 [Thalassotalea sp. 42_200_T64]